MSSAEELVAAWQEMWNTYDLDQVPKLLLDDSRLTYLSSERQGVIQGMPEAVAHHVGFGFVRGGKATGNRLWLSGLCFSNFDCATVVAGLWHFRRASGVEMRGPVTLVCVPTADGMRLAHLNFGNYPPDTSG